MGIKNSKKLHNNEVRTTFRYARAFIVFALLIALIAIIFFAVSCQSNKSIVTDGLDNAYVNVNEMQANYLLASQKALNDSLPNIAVLLRAAATMEEVHNLGLKILYKNYMGSDMALNRFDTLKNIKVYNTGQNVMFLIDSTKANIKNLIGKQYYLINTLFESLAAEMVNINEKEIAQAYTWYLQSEQAAYRLFSEAYENFRYAGEFTDKYNVCPRCGNIYIYDDGVEYCTVCHQPASKFILVQ